MNLEKPSSMVFRDSSQRNALVELAHADNLRKVVVDDARFFHSLKKSKAYSKRNSSPSARTFSSKSVLSV